MVERLFTKKFLLCSDIKDSGYKYLHKSEAVNKNFIQFNANCLSTLSIDIDYCDRQELNNRLSTLPTPSIIVQTSKGFHVHYVLNVPVSYKNTRRLKWAKHIKDVLTQSVQGDKHAKGSIRVFRNPRTHQSTINDIEYSLEDFNIPYPIASRKNTTSKSKHKFIDFTQVKTGDRHMSLFNYVRHQAYSLGNRDDLTDILEFLVNEANDKLEEPLSMPETQSIVTSVVRFMSKYTGRKEQTEFNRSLAKAKQDKTVSRILGTLGSVSFKKVSSSSSRALGRLCKVSPQTITKHKVHIVHVLRNKVLSNISMSYEEYQRINILTWEELLSSTKFYYGGLKNDIPI